MRITAMLFLAALAVSCKPEFQPKVTALGPPLVSTDLDGGVHAVNTAELCGVTMIFNYLDQMVGVINSNDRAIRFSLDGYKIDIPPKGGPKGDDLWQIGFNRIARGSEKHVSVIFTEQNGLLGNVPEKTCTEVFVLGQ